MIYHGACHCGAVSAAYETSGPVRLRADGCSFCKTRGVKSASDPEGKLAIVSTQKLTRYRFGHKSADFLICPICGTYVATYMESEGGPIGVINVAGMNIEEFRNLPVTLTSLEGESPEQRIARRVSRWTPMTLTEPAS
jgi:hypothetical protein